MSDVAYTVYCNNEWSHINHGFRFWLNEILVRHSVVFSSLLELLFNLLYWCKWITTLNEGQLTQTPLKMHQFVWNKHSVKSKAHFHSIRLSFRMGTFAASHTAAHQHPVIIQSRDKENVAPGIRVSSWYYLTLDMIFCIINLFCVLASDVMSAGMRVRCMQMVKRLLPDRIHVWLVSVWCVCILAQSSKFPKFYVNTCLCMFNVQGGQVSCDPRGSSCPIAPCTHPVKRNQCCPSCHSKYLTHTHTQMFCIRNEQLKSSVILSQCVNMKEEFMMMEVGLDRPVMDPAWSVHARWNFPLIKSLQNPQTDMKDAQ